MTLRITSGSFSDPREVEPTISAKRTVTSLRSSGMPGFYAGELVERGLRDLQAARQLAVARMDHGGDPGYGRFVFEPVLMNEVPAGVDQVLDQLHLCRENGVVLVVLCHGTQRRAGLDEMTDRLVKVGIGRVERLVCVSHVIDDRVIEDVHQGFQSLELPMERAPHRVRRPEDGLPEGDHPWTDGRSIGVDRRLDFLHVY